MVFTKLTNRLKCLRCEESHWYSSNTVRQLYTTSSVRPDRGQWPVHRMKLLNNRHVHTVGLSSLRQIPLTSRRTILRMSRKPSDLMSTKNVGSVVFLSRVRHRQYQRAVQRSIYLPISRETRIYIRLARSILPIALQIQRPCTCTPSHFSYGAVILAFWVYISHGTYTSLTVLNSTFEALVRAAFLFSDFYLVLAG